MNVMMIMNGMVGVTRSVERRMICLLFENISLAGPYIVQSLIQKSSNLNTPYEGSSYGWALERLSDQPSNVINTHIT
jgi:hypothetical protein